jgi:copper(I)-binding protein
VKYAANGAAYFTITSPAADEIVGVKIDPAVAKTAQMHETVMAPDSTMAMGTGTTMAGMGEMTMQPVERIALPAGEAVSLQPGGIHVMLMDLMKPLEKGASIELTLSLRTAGEIVIVLPVLDEAP